MKDKFLSVNLKIPIELKLSVDTCNLMTSNKALLLKYGINLDKQDEITLFIRSVPKCLVKSNHRNNDTKLISNIRSLLKEVEDNVLNNNGINFLPTTINNAIAMEACRGN